VLIFTVVKNSKIVFDFCVCGRSVYFDFVSL